MQWQVPNFICYKGMMLACNECSYQICPFRLLATKKFYLQIFQNKFYHKIKQTLNWHNLWRHMPPQLWLNSFISMLAMAVIGEHPDTNSTDVPKRTLCRPGDHQPMRERVAELRSRHKLYCSGAICRMLQCDLTYRIERCDALAMLRFRHCAARRSSANERESSRAEIPTQTLL